MLSVAILAAGKGTRMKSKLPKVLQPLGGRTLLERVLSGCIELKPDRLFVIVGHQAELVKSKACHVSGVEFIEQNPQNGTGHAIQQLIPALADFEGELLVLNGDVPLLRQETLERLVSQHRESNSEATFLSAKLENPNGYGRVFSDEKGQVSAIIEDRDCNKKELENNLTNAGIYCFNWNTLKAILPNLSNKNNQKEVYLTDAVSMVKKAMHLQVNDVEEVCGINDRLQMAECEALLQQRLRKFWMNNGVTFTDESSSTISDNCVLGKDVIIEPQTHLRGKCHIGDNCRIGPGSFIEDSWIGANVKILYSVIRDAKIGDNVEIGPYAHLRPNTDIAQECKIGNFVEIKNSVLGLGTKVNHLSYIGDSVLGKKVNIGAGTITANYDGRRKHRTIIGDETKTGANSVLIAPITLGAQVTVGAGSTLTRNVPDGSLAIARTKQLTKKEWTS